MRPPVLSIVSKKNSGKTTLLEKLIPEMKRRGYRVGTIKHDTHGFEIDHKGKDTWRHKQAGAETVAISSPWKISIIKDVAEEISLERIVDQHFKDMDIVITEGYKHAQQPQIEVFRKAAHDEPLHSKTNIGSLKAIVSDTHLDIGVPCLDINDTHALADFIEQTFLIGVAGR